MGRFLCFAESTILESLRAPIPAYNSIFQQGVTPRERDTQISSVATGATENHVAETPRWPQTVNLVPALGRRYLVSKEARGFSDSPDCGVELSSAPSKPELGRRGEEGKSRS